MNTLALITPPDTEVRTPNQPLRVVGIDLGTTNSTIAEIVWRPGDAGAPEVRCLEVEQPTRQGPYTHTMVPSVVALHGGQVLVGEGAKNLRTRVREFDLELFKNIFWDCKNHIGIQRTYHKAPPGFQSAKAIAGHLLKFMADAALTDDDTTIGQTVVTAPASFQAAQRNDTVDAAELAGLELGGGALLDEPIAAFLDYLVSHDAEAFGDVTASRFLVVFDFGGGTCDVALFQLLPSQPGRLFQIAPLTVSRYHRLGGGDIDRAIVVNVLLPQLIGQNALEPHALDFNAKDKFVIPALLGLAEALKIGLCQEIARLKRFDRYTDEARAGLVKKNPGVYACSLPDGTELRLQSPTLSAVQFDKILKPFLDVDLLYARETDYGLTCSIFAPLEDAVERARLSADEVDLCLMVGGSSLIPQIPEALAGFFSAARLMRFDDPDLVQTAMARGAAWQALSLALYGRGIIQPIANDSIRIQTLSGPVELIAPGVELPYPADGGWAENTRLVVPETGLTEPVRVRIELRDSHDAVLACQVWEIGAMVSKGDGLLLRYRMDGNQVLRLQLALADEPEEECSFTIENPLTNVVNPNAKRDRIAKLEEQMRTKAIPKVEQRETVQEIALLYADLGQRERALGLLSNLLKAGPDLNILNRMGIICGEMGDFERQERFYREAAKISDSSIPLFNLALSQRRQGRRKDAMQTVDQAIARYPDPPYFVLKAQISDTLKQKEQRDEMLTQAFAAFDPLANLNDWELGWYLTGAQLTRDSQRQQAAEEERKRRKKPGEPMADNSVLLDAKTEIARR